MVEIDFALLQGSTYEEWKSSRKITDKNIKSVLEKTGLARKDKNKTLKPTRASVLLFAEFPTDLLDTKCAIRIFQYSEKIESVGETPNLISLPKTISGPINKQISEAHEYILNLLRNGIRVPSGFINQYQLPERVIKEAVTNAVIHRDYYIKRDIIVRIFEDRVEIESPGLFPYNITPANIGYVRSEGYRNDLLVKHLRELPSPPNLNQNEGVRAMRSEMRSSNLYPPIFFTYPHLDDSVRVVLLNEIVATEWEKVSHFLQHQKYINNEQARDITGVQQRDKMARLLKKWVDSGLLIRLVPQTGYVKATRYRLAESPVLNSFVEPATS